MVPGLTVAAAVGVCTVPAVGVLSVTVTVRVGVAFALVALGLGIAVALGEAVVAPPEMCIRDRSRAMPAQNTPRPQPIARPDTQQGIQLAYQAKPARRTHHRLLTPPLAQKNGIDPIQLILPRVEELPAELTPNNTAPATIADYLVARFYPNDPQIIEVYKRQARR